MPRRESDARGSVSTDLMGKFSAIIRRGSQYRPTLDGLGGVDDDNNNNNYSIEDDETQQMGGNSPNGTMMMAPATLSATHAGKGFGFNFAANMRRFSKAAGTSPPSDEVLGASPPSTTSEIVDATVAMVTRADEPERQRRYDLEVMSFAFLHEHFQPMRAPELDDDGAELDDENDEGMDGDSNQEDNQQRPSEDAHHDAEEEEFLRRRSRLTTADATEDDEDVGGLLGRRYQQESSEISDSISSSASSSYGDGADVYRYSIGVDDDEAKKHDREELNFDHANLSASVRKLVFQIESASMSEVDSNQDDDDGEEEHSSTTQHQMSDDDDHQEGDDTVGERLLPNGMMEPFQPRRVTYPMVPFSSYPAAASSMSTARVMNQSCYIPMDEVQEDLTQSVRRLVIGLKTESELQEGASHQTALPFVRRRGNSCPPPYCPPTSQKTPGADPSVSAAAASLSMEMAAPPPEPPRWRKRSAFARLAPKFLDNFRRKRKSYLYTDEELESIEGARWKIVELAFRFGGKHRFYLVQAVNMFFPLIKYGRHGGPHPTRLHCNRCGTLQWQHKRGGLSDAVDLADVLQIIDGRQTAVFHKYSTSKTLDGNSLSLIFKERTLDLETQSSSHRDWLMSALRTLVAYARKQRHAEQRAIAERAIMSLGDASSSESSVSQSRAVYSSRVASTDAGPMLLW